MSSIAVILAGGFVVILAAFAVLVLVPGRRRLPTPLGAGSGLTRLRRVSLAGRLASLLLGAALVVVASGLGGLGRGLMLAPALFGGTQILGVLAVDLLVRNTARTPGVAGLEVRRVRDVVPVRLAVTAVVAAALLAGWLSWTTLVASPDDQGRAGRALSYRCVDGCDAASLGPWPGSYYAIPLAVALFVVVALAATALRQVVLRPRNGTDPEVLRVDGAVRRRAGESVVAAAAVAIVASLAGIAAVAGLGLLRADQAPARLTVMAWPALVTAVAALAVAAWCLTVLLLPGVAERTTPRRAARAGAR